MTERAVGRRRMLQGAGAVAGGAAIAGLGAAAPASAGDGRRGGVLGSWVVTRQDDGDPQEVTAVFSFAGGGVMVEHDILPAGPPFTGTWARTSGGGFRATIWSGFPGEGGPGSPGSTIEVHLSGAASHGTISGTYEFTVFDAEGTEIFAGTGSFSGTRLRA